MTHFGIVKGMLFSVALLGASSAPPAPTHAANDAPDKPQISIVTKYLEISVTIRSELRPFTELFANCLAGGKAWASKTNADTASEWRGDPKLFRGQQWLFDRVYELRSVVDQYVSMVCSDGSYAGGAHPNQHIDTILWDDTPRKRVSIRPFFTETADNGPTMTALAQAAKLSVAVFKLANDINGYDDNTPAAKDMTPEQELEHDRFINDGIKPALLKIGPVTLTPSTEPGKSSGLTFHSSPYDVGPYVERPYTVFVPWTAFRQYLSPQGAALFAGERPKSDEDKW